MSVTIVKPLHVGISVSDMDKSLAWYEKNLGFVKSKDDYVPPLKARICFIERDGFELELFQHDEAKAMPAERRNPNEDIMTIGTKHIAFEVSDMAAVKKELVANGVDIALETSMGSESVMFVRDVDGILVELIQK